MRAGGTPIGQLKLPFSFCMVTGMGATSRCLTRISQSNNFIFFKREFVLLRLCNTNGVPIGQLKFPLNFRIFSETKFFAKLSPKESGGHISFCQAFFKKRLSNIATKRPPYSGHFSLFKNVKTPKDHHYGTRYYYRKVLQSLPKRHIRDTLSTFLKARPQTRGFRLS